jgi:septum formation protein
MAKSRSIGVGAKPQAVKMVLASSSPARRELMQQAGYSFTVQPANVDEPTTGFADPRTFVQAVSWLKATAVAPTVADGLVLAADTIGWIDGGPVLKPENEADARRILRQLGGRDHELWTGVVLWRRPDDLQIIWQERSLVRMRAMTDAEMDTYLATREWRNNSGAYAIMREGDPHVSVVEGSVTNVIGLPMETLTARLAWLTSGDRP